MFDQVGVLTSFADREYENSPRDRYAGERHRLHNALYERLADRLWIVGDRYTGTDMATSVDAKLGCSLRGGRLGSHLRIFPGVRVFHTFVSLSTVAKGLNIPIAT
jgi:GST-like protein